MAGSDTKTHDKESQERADFFDQLHEKLEGLEEQWTRIKAYRQRVSEEARAGLEAQVNTLDKKRHDVKAKIDGLRHDLDRPLSAVKADAEHAFQELKQAYEKVKERYLPHDR